MGVGVSRGSVMTFSLGGKRIGGRKESTGRRASAFGLDATSDMLRRMSQKIADAGKRVDNGVGGGSAGRGGAGGAESHGPMSHLAHRVDGAVKFMATRMSFRHQVDADELLGEVSEQSIKDQKRKHRKASLFHGDSAADMHGEKERPDRRSKGRRRKVKNAGGDELSEQSEPSGRRRKHWEPKTADYSI